MKRVFPVAVMAMAMLASGTMSLLRAADAPKFTTKQVMAEAHNPKTGIAAKVVAGKATDAEKDKLIELYEALALNKPPKGSEESWKAKTDALIEAAKGAKAGDADALKKLDAAKKCGACHSAHK